MRTCTLGHTTSELVQAIGRSRYVNKKRTIYVLSNHNPLKEFYEHAANIDERHFGRLVTGIAGGPSPARKNEAHVAELAAKLFKDLGKFTIRDIEELASKRGCTLAFQTISAHMGFVKEYLGLMEIKEKEQGRGRPATEYLKSP